jgi:hypothetical protein
MPWSRRTLQRFEERTTLLEQNVLGWLENLQNVPIQWEGPSLYFHKVLVNSANEIPNLVARAANPFFAERLYACLASWGMHRFDNPNARLVDYQAFCEQIDNLARQLAPFTNLRLHELDLRDFQAVSDAIGQLIDQTHVVVAGWPLVANTKLIHHILPHLVPPIDRKYTLKYFINRTDDSSNAPSYSFEKVFRSFWRVAVANAQALSEMCVDTWVLPNAWNTTIPKIIDNALVLAP